MSLNETIKREVGNLMWFIAIPQLISTPLSVWIIERLKPDIVQFQILELLDFVIISFPLTVAIAIITYLVKTDQATPVGCIFVILAAAFASNMLHRFVFAGFPNVPLYRAYYDVMGSVYEEYDPVYRSQGITPWFRLAIKMLMIYWQQFGIVMCLQALGIGVYSGMRYFNKESR